MQLHWIDTDYVFGRGSVCELGGRGTIELIPFVRDDGTGELGGYALAVDGRINCRIAGELPAVQAEAERVLKVRYPRLFAEAAA